jgi:hypothetical protein
MTVDGGSRFAGFGALVSLAVRVSLVLASLQVNVPEGAISWKTCSGGCTLSVDWKGRIRNLRRR